MSHATDYRTLISRGRKAGLNTAEIYSALATRSSEGSDPVMGEADSNGFTRNYNQDGKRVYRPIGSYPRP